MLPPPVRAFLDRIAELSLEEWRRVSKRWAQLDPRAFDTADRSMVFAIQARQVARGSNSTATAEVRELDAEIMRLVNSIRFLGRDGAQVSHAEVDAMRAAAVAAGFAILARDEIDPAEYATLVSPFEPFLAA